jgi:hypothetical protein
MLMEQLGISNENEWAQQAETALDGFDGVKTLMEGHDAQVTHGKHACKTATSRASNMRGCDVMTMTTAAHVTCRVDVRDRPRPLLFSCS